MVWSDSDGRQIVSLLTRMEAASSSEARKLLAQLRELCARHGGNSPILAEGLVQCIATVGSVEAMDLLDELRSLQRADGDLKLIDPLLRGLMNMLPHVSGKEAAGLLDELRSLRRRHPDPAKARGLLAMALVNILMNERAGDRASILKELRSLHDSHPGDLEVVQAYGRGLSIDLGSLAQGEVHDRLSRIRLLYRNRDLDPALVKTFGHLLLAPLMKESRGGSERIFREFFEICHEHSDDPVIAESLLALISTMGLSASMGGCRPGKSSEWEQNPEYPDLHMRLMVLDQMREHGGWSSSGPR